MCGVEACDKEFSTACKLRDHYELHDPSLRRKFLECRLCDHTEFGPGHMKKHVDREHPEVLFLQEAGPDHWTSVKGNRFEEFKEEVSVLLGEPPEAEQEQEEEEELDLQCNFCAASFNTASSYQDHNKVHQPGRVSFLCSTCNEGFIVESVYRHHTRGHHKPWTRLPSGRSSWKGNVLFYQNVIQVPM